MSDSVANLLVSGLMGLIGGLITIPLNALFNWWLKRNELLLRSKLERINKQRELLLRHEAEAAKRESARLDTFEKELGNVKAEINQIKLNVTRLEKKSSE